MKKENNDFFMDLENTRPFVKIGFEGFAGSGKTYTASQIAIGLHKSIKSEKPIVFYDTEKSIKALKPIFDKEGITVKVRESRTLADLTKSIDICLAGYSEILIIDSLSHVWENFLESYKKQKRRDDLYFNDWGIIKPKWKHEFSDKFVNANMHIIFTGRAGYEYDDIVNEKGKKEIVKSGIKMKAENETAYEPDLLILMERREDVIGRKKSISREATVLKDRTTQIDGKTFKNPSYTEFKPAIDQMLDGAFKYIKIEEGEDEFSGYEDGIGKWRKEKTIALEEIESLFVALGIGTSKDEKKLKVDIIDRVFGTTSWTAVTQIPLTTLQEKSLMLKDFKREYLNYYKECADGLKEFNIDKVYDILDSCSEVHQELFSQKV